MAHRGIIRLHDITKPEDQHEPGSEQATTLPPHSNARFRKTKNLTWSNSKIEETLMAHC